MTKIYVLLIATAVSFFGCTATKQTTGNQRVPAKFDFSPPSRDQVGSAGMTIALVKAKYIGNHPEYYVPPFNEMASSMANDFEELLTAKGFTVRGPFGSRDEMVYNDKQNTNFALDVDIDLNPQYNMHNQFNAGFGIYKAPSWKSAGEITLSGSLVLTASSPQYGEKIWKKNIALNPATFNYTSDTKWNHEPSMADLLKGDNEVYNTLSRELEKFYQQAMNLAWRQIEVVEMKSVVEQAKKADKKS